MPVDGVSAPTLPVGESRLTWDSAKAPLNGLKPGSYALVVEAAREVGGRELIRVPFDWNGKNAKAEAKGEKKAQDGDAEPPQTCKRCGPLEMLARVDCPYLLQSKTRYFECNVCKKRAEGVALHWATVGSTTEQPASVGVATQAASVGRTVEQPACAGAATQAAMLGRTTEQPGRVGVDTQVAMLGRTAEQPARVGVTTQADSVGSTTEQPDSVGVAVHCATVGSTAEQPVSVGEATQAAIVGRTAEQPVMLGAAVQSARDGRRTWFWTVMRPVIDSSVDEFVHAPAADRTMLPSWALTGLSAVRLPPALI
jgi:hypothetical protein